MRRPLDDLLTERLRVRGRWVEVRYRFLEPGNDVGHGRDVLGRVVAAHIIAKPDVDSAVPKPANSDVDFAVVDFLVRQKNSWVDSGSGNLPKE